jgi:hypothetical protein
MMDHDDSELPADVATGEGYPRATRTIAAAERRRYPPPGRWYATLAPMLVRHGYAPVPCTGKRCFEPRWQSTTPSEPRIAAWCRTHASHGVGIVLHSLVAIDIDADDRGLADRLDAAALEMLGEAPVRIGQWPRRARLYRSDGTIATSDGAVEIRTGARTLNVFGPHPNTRKPYTWLGASPMTVPAAELLQIQAQQVAAFRADLARLLPDEVKPTRESRLTTTPTRAIETAPSAYIARAIEAEFDTLSRAPIGQRNSTLNTVAYTLSRFVAARRLNGNILADNLLEAAVAIGLTAAEARSTIVSALRARGTA